MGANKNTRPGMQDLAADWVKIKSAFHDTAEDVQAMADDALSHSMENLKERSQQIEMDIVDYTVKKPLTALAIAALAGFILGCWWKR